MTTAQTVTRSGIEGFNDGVNCSVLFYSLDRAVEGLYIIPCSGPSESLAGVVISPLFWWLALAIVVRSPQLEAIARPGFCDTNTLGDT